MQDMIGDCAVEGLRGVAATGNDDDKPADWHVQTGKAPAMSLFWENVLERLAMVMTIGEGGAATRLLGLGNREIHARS